MPPEVEENNEGRGGGLRGGELPTSKTGELEAYKDLKFRALAEGSKHGEMARDIQSQINLRFKCEPRKYWTSCL